MNSLRASVLITTFNRADKLKDAIGGALAQELDDNFEIIIVDDCSGDHTQDVVEDIQRDVANVKYVRHRRNLGNAIARNTGLAVSSGDFIAFLDDDDVWTDPLKLKDQIAALEAEPNEGEICFAQVLEKGRTGLELKPAKVPDDLMAHLLTGNGVIFNSTVVVRASAIRAVGGFDEKMPRGVDSDFFRRLFVKFGSRGVFLARPMAVCNVFDDDRITTAKGWGSALKHLKANSRVIWKHRRIYLKRPSALARRITVMCTGFLRSLT